MNPLLQKMLDEQRVPHALIFCGKHKSQLQENAHSFGLKLVQSSLPHHPDLHKYNPTGKLALHAIESIRALLDEAAFDPACGKRKVFIISDAERMLPVSAHALLKTIEEPTSAAVFILLATSADKILPTLRSRCQEIYFSKTAGRASKYQAQFLAFLDERPTLKEIEQFAKEIEKEHKEKRMSKHEGTPRQLERLEKEFESESTLAFQEEIEALLDVLVTWGYEKNYYHKCEKLAQSVHLALSRGLSLQSCFEKIFLTG